MLLLSGECVWPRWFSLAMLQFASEGKPVTPRVFQQGLGWEQAFFLPRALSEPLAKQGDTAPSIHHPLIPPRFSFHLLSLSKDILFLFTNCKAGET